MLLSSLRPIRCRVEKLFDAESHSSGTFIHALYPHLGFALYLCQVDCLERFHLNFRFVEHACKTWKQATRGTGTAFSQYLRPYSPFIQCAAAAKSSFNATKAMRTFYFISKNKIKNCNGKPKVYIILNRNI